MRPITGTDIIDFHNTRYELLILTSDGQFDHIDYSDTESDRTDSYAFITLEDDSEAQVLLERSTIDEGEWFPDALDDGGDLISSVADEMAAIINTDGIIPSRAMKAVEAGKEWKNAEEETNRLALQRAKAVAEVVAYCGGNQSRAASILGIDQSTVNKLVRKTKAT